MESYSPTHASAVGARVEKHLPDAHPCHHATPANSAPGRRTGRTPHGHLWCRSIRHALISLQERLPETEPHKAVMEHVHSEAKLYPGRARRGLPPGSSSDAAKS